MTDDLLERADRAARIAVNRDLIGALASAVREARCERDEARARLSALTDAIESARMTLNKHGIQVPALDAAVQPPDPKEAT
jgi:hypothetical protein